MSVNYIHDRLSASFINLTDSTVCLYESCSGQMWTFPPSTDPLPEAPAFEPGAPLLHYIVEPEMAKQLEESGRSLEDIAIVVGKTAGRHDREITKLVWGKKPSANVRLYRDFKKDPHKSYKPPKRL